MDITPQRIKHMKSGTDISREMNKLYGEARKGIISTQDLSRYGAFLNLLLGVIRETELQTEIRELHEAIETQNIPLRDSKPRLINSVS